MTGPRAIVWLAPGREALAAALPLRPPLRAFRSSLGLLVAGEPAADHDLPRLLASGARVFLLEGDGAWVEARAGGERGPIAAPPAPPGFAHLVSARGEVWSPPDPASWPPLAEALPVAWPAEDAPGAPLPRLRVRLAPAAPGPSRDGILCRAGEGGAVAAHLAGLPAADLRDLRRGEADGWWWIFAPRGLERGFPRAGRALQNLGTPLEPVLVPADREPSPRLLAADLRRLLGAAEGEGIVWWDDAGGEKHAVFLRSSLPALTPGAVLGKAW
jgi:hypothetical protein